MDKIDIMPRTLGAGRAISATDTEQHRDTKRWHGGACLGAGNPGRYTTGDQKKQESAVTFQMALTLFGFE